MRGRALLGSVVVMLARFAVMAAVAWLAGSLGWYAGLVVNAVLSLMALALVHRRGLWGRLGGVRPPSRLALLWLIPFGLDIALWVVPHGLQGKAPGFLPWAATLLLVGLNEELFVRGVVLDLLESAYTRVAAVVLSSCLFGLQHLSNLVLTDRGTLDVLENVLLSGVHGLAYAAFMVRFRWIWPLVVVHGIADFVKVLAARPLPDAAIVAEHVGLLALAVALLVTGRRRASADDDDAVPVAVA
ncbi:CPBP family intramembrane glutamic endopeptidase [Luteipulveratus flavus]|uniref:CPBP family intramembrane glutamic endopeptidase n=1 Tax=Luteipulveratus flavus TaxID=3031728 RepID=UPI0023B1AF2C|nr:CPBP family intramembrane glutamic endopeptidase [Luteipulveratus sp. YIM 133132]